ncbi:MAG: NAD(P)/FAD-dependent oxidoreductase [Gammaproteobacteria bacterium]|nr:NAD(P)/FAD-dependent oxidoreductase [Gammaproteobacteria bacterium]MDH5240550.1 NAD(P)/FAD-dependent oxidoreductase [Gammaproteobacteria bacterium]MDH5259860.1 NAD(P)/FAD-dependent oxidoreductase [Gammaproteobacteria bacterium]
MAYSTATEGNMQYDVIIIGAGHNGLTTAAYLAKGGRKVLMLERNDTVGGCAVTEEVDAELAPGCRVSTASYIASMLRPTIIKDLRLGSYGLKMVACDPGVQAAFDDNDVVGWWSNEAKMRAELSRVAPQDVDSFFTTEAELKRLAAYLQPFFLEAPPDLNAKGLAKLTQAWRLYKRFGGIKSKEISGLLRFLTGSLGEFLDQRFASDKLKRLILSNSLYGKHGGPYQPGTAMGLLFHLLSGGDADQQAWQGHVIGGMGAITQAMRGACEDLGVTIRTGATVKQINVVKGTATGVTLVDGDVLDAKVVVSNADPKRTFLGLVNASDLDADFRRDVSNIRMDGPAGKVNYVLSEEPNVSGMPADRSKAQRSLFTLIPTLQEAEDNYNASKRGDLPDRLWVDCVVASNVDDTLAPAGCHMMTCFVQYLPYKLRDTSWDEQREALGDRVTSLIGQFAPNVPGAVIARRVITPPDLETQFGITEGNIFHGDISLDQMFFMRPVPEWSQYQTPICGLYLCGAGTHPGGGVTGAPGYNAAHAILRNSP